MLASPAAPESAGPAAAPSPEGADRERARALRRMKLAATSFLVAAGLLYLIAVYAERGGAGGWARYARAAAEAGMIGGLADWFAVTALFRRPLGLPIPHTALIPTRKQALGRSLADFVGSQFLAPDVVRERILRSAVPRRVGEWLSQRDHAERVSAELAVGLRAGVGVLRDDDVRAALEEAVLTRLSGAPVAPVLGRILAEVVQDGAHHDLVDLAVRELQQWLQSNADTVIEAITAQAPRWSPRFVDDRVAAKVYTEALRVVGDVAADPQHPFRQSLDAYLARLAADLRTDPVTIERTEAAKRALLQRADVREAFGNLLAAGRRLLLELIDDPHSQLRRQLTDALAGLGEQLKAHGALADKVETWLADAAAYVVANYRDELTSLITDTVDRWDAQDASRRIELHVGRDLQYIRINGTVVGGLAGLAIYAITQLLP
ncbi:MAG: hypothetical protein QOE19_2725 [Actinomycetota bacterium]|nr:hypothetical protein [Actinomycetota bacterium]MDQ1665373.1 hypothetical protein [Actinomycetota bacterium]